MRRVYGWEGMQEKELRKIVVCLDEEENRVGIERLKEELGREQVELVVMSGEEELCKLEEDKRDMLVLTDNEAVFERLIEEDFFVLPVLNDKNQSASFWGALYVLQNLEEIDYSYLEFVYTRHAGLPMTILETERCVIREITVADVDALYEIYKEPSITKFMEDLYPTKEQEISYTRDYIKNVYGFYGYGMWIVEKKDTGEIIGRAGVEQHENEECVEMGFVIARPFQRQGYAYEVCSAILRYAKEELEVSKICCLVKEGNTASLGLCKKLGFQHIGKQIAKGEEYEALEYRH